MKCIGRITMPVDLSKYMYREEDTLTAVEREEIRAGCEVNVREDYPDASVSISREGDA